MHVNSVTTHHDVKLKITSKLINGNRTHQMFLSAKYENQKKCIATMLQIISMHNVIYFQSLRYYGKWINGTATHSEVLLNTDGMYCLPHVHYYSTAFVMHCYTSDQSNRGWVLWTILDDLHGHHFKPKNKKMQFKKNSGYCNHTCLFRYCHYITWEYIIAILINS